MGEKGVVGLYEELERLETKRTKAED